MRDLRVSVDGGVAAADLQDWLSAQGYSASILSAADTMSVGDVVVIAAGSAAILRSIMPAVVEWIRSRRTTAELRFTKTSYLRIDAGSDPNLVLEAIDRALAAKDNN